MQGEIRRQDRVADQEQTRRVLEQGEYGVLSSVSPDGQPYGTPLSYWLMDGDIYFHCALAGHMLENIAANDRVSFCVVGKTQVLPDKFSTLYESVVAFGRVSEAPAPDKRAALEGLVAKYSPGYPAEGGQYIDKLIDRARVFKIAVEAVSGKARNA
ncbi:MAG: pyridoxamine 5'-phosphate oxidase family protein [Proteobacteria bacterium]|nr:pyridoxamine 5'-phosphate oxidase family protein [Pseudomonadota bacterium]MBU4576431.1 pyridoxamine 5'-phosphate oxidase family protein [Pseudomonadota bacterium]MBU4599096.1 pyridoxamine 5'-phosphate oxidase family protein [Pseudomonadota bacterium]MBV1714851.1 pyridoxamine 5'-phosphate oxidase family protein [Desulfarculus sp.]MBV1753131.1 pyridoxamine 5'-phosphate oxidase family protein [Desulfarculus sp.]